MFVGRARGASASRCRDRPGVRLVVGLRGLDAASQSSAGSTTEQGSARPPTRLAEPRTFVRWSSPGSVSEPVSRPPWGAAASRLARSRRGLAELGRLDHQQSPLEHRSAGCRSSPGSVSEPASRPPWGAAACRLARSRRGLAELGRLDHRTEPARASVRWLSVEAGERQRAGVETALGCGWLSACAVSTRPRRARPARPPTRVSSSIGPLFVGRGWGASASRCRDRPGVRLLLGLRGLDTASQSSAGSTTEQEAGSTTDKGPARPPNGGRLALGRAGATLAGAALARDVAVLTHCRWGGVP